MQYCTCKWFESTKALGKLQDRQIRSVGRWIACGGLVVWGRRSCCHEWLRAIRNLDVHGINGHTLAHNEIVDIKREAKVFCYVLYLCDCFAFLVWICWKYSSACMGLLQHWDLCVRSTNSIYVFLDGRTTGSRERRQSDSARSFWWCRGCDLVWLIARNIAQNCLTPRIPLGMTEHPARNGGAFQRQDWHGLPALWRVCLSH